MIKQEKMTRRKFIQHLSAGAVSVSSLGMLSSCLEKERSLSRPMPMPMRTLGKTNLKVSILSFGGGSQFIKNKDGDWEPLLERAVEMGINFFDTSTGYQWKASMTSEQRYGQILPKYRDKIILCTKFNSREVETAKKEFEQSLKQMKVDYVDILMLHSVEPSEDLSAFEKGLYKEMIKLKEQGLARFLGFSSMNSAEKSKELIDKLDLDAVMIAMNPTKYGDFAKVALPAAHKKNMGVLAMKVVRDIVGKEAMAKELLHYAWTQEGVASAVVGHYGMATLEENVHIAKEFGITGKTSIDNKALETKLAHLAGPHALCWARPDYFDGMMC